MTNRLPSIHQRTGVYDAVWTTNLIRKTYSCDCENEQGGEGERVNRPSPEAPLIANPSGVYFFQTFFQTANHVSGNVNYTVNG